MQSPNQATSYRRERTLPTRCPPVVSTAADVAASATAAATPTGALPTRIPMAAPAASPARTPFHTSFFPAAQPHADVTKVQGLPHRKSLAHYDGRHPRDDAVPNVLLPCSAATCRH